MRAPDAGRSARFFGLAVATIAASVGVGARAAADEPAQPGATGYEQPESLRASEILPPELRSGPHHRVDEEVRSDGLHRVFTVRSADGSFEARGEEDLRRRIREIEATAALRERNEAGGGARPDSGTAERGLAGWVRTPGRDDGGTRPGGGRLVDLDAMKRQVAHELGIDPYTENPDLQRELDRHVFSVFATGRGAIGLPGGAAAPAPGAGGGEEAAAGAEASAPETTRAGELVRDYSADDLERLARIELAVMGVDEQLREQFLDNPWYSPRDGTELVDALSALDGTEGRSTFIEAAVKAGSPEEAHSYQRMAELMRRYAHRVGSLQRFTRVGSRVAAYAEDGTLIVPVEADHALWTPDIAAFATAIARAAGQDPEVARTRLLVSGKLSRRARQEIEGLGIDVTEEAMGDAPGKPIPGAP